MGNLKKISNPRVPFPVKSTVSTSTSFSLTNPQVCPFDTRDAIHFNSTIHYILFSVGHETGSLSKTKWLVPIWNNG